MRPSSGRTSSSRTRTRLVLPAPFGPMSVTISPGCTARWMESRTVRPSSARLTPSAAISGASGPCITACLAAVGATPGQLDDRPLDGKAGGLGAAADRPVDAPVVQLRRRAATGADQELSDMVAVGMRAADIGVEAGDAVHQPVRNEEIERAIDGRRRDAAALAAQPLEDGISPHGLMAAPDQLEHAAADLGEAGSAARAEPLGGFKRLRHAVGMVVAFRPKGDAAAPRSGHGRRSHAML